MHTAIDGRRRRRQRSKPAASKDGTDDDDDKSIGRATVEHRFDGTRRFIDIGRHTMAHNESSGSVSGHVGSVRRRTNGQFTDGHPRSAINTVARL